MRSHQYFKQFFTFKFIWWHDAMKISNPFFLKGYTSITQMNDLPWNDPKNPKMDFGILKLDANESQIFETPFEKAFLLMEGQVQFRWQLKPDKYQESNARRTSCFEENPWCFHVPKFIKVQLTAGLSGATISFIQTKNDANFPLKVYTPQECRSENRGAGTMRETSTRIVRTIFDQSNAPHSNLVLGEVITFPGKWSSYPPHHHPQPEIYHYRFFPDHGFGFGMLGDEVLKIRNGDTVLILNDISHPQVAAPGYAMYYLWVIRHLESQRYISPVYESEHLWVMDPKKQKEIWPPENDSCKPCCV